MHIDELTVKDIKRGRDWHFLDLKGRTDELKMVGSLPRYEGIDPPIVQFTTRSSDFATNRMVYNQDIVLLDFNDAIQQVDLRLNERVNLMIAGDIAIRCTCPAYLFFGQKYILTQLDANAEEPPENRFPRIRNPGLKSTVCKHLSNVMDVFPFYISDITGELRRLGYDQQQEEE